MGLILSSLFAIVPLLVALLMIKQIKETKLSLSLFLFLFFASVWQFDVTILYAYNFLSIEVIDFLFRLLRVGSIMMTPTLFFIARSFAKYMEIDNISLIWRFLINKYVVLFYYLLGAIAYIIGWSHKGIKDYILIESDKHASFYFPVYGSYSWIFNINIAFFVLAIIVCFHLTAKLKNNDFKSTFLVFIAAISIGSGIGMLNMFPEAKLYASGVAVGFIAFSIFALLMRLHIKIINDMNKELDSQKNFLQTVIDLNPNYIYAKNEAGVFSLANKAFATMYGLTPDNIIGRSNLAISNDDAIIENFFGKEGTHDTGEVFAVEEEIRDIHGNKKWLQTFKIPIVTSESKLLLGVSSDITKLKMQEERIRKLAYLDDLTLLPNRRLFYEDLPVEIEKTKEKGEQLALIFIDLDRFKYINDTLGHNVGDLLLTEIAALFKKVIKKVDNQVKVYRLGGDEFTVIIQKCERDFVTKLANSILDIFVEPIQIESQSLFITPSIGISIYPHDGNDASTLMKNADSAMYYVKDRTKNSYQYYKPEINQHFHRKLLVEKQLRNALKQKEFEIHYQPQLDIQSGRTTGMEALIRWNNSELGNVAPDEFIPLAEETNLILPIGKWILKEACLQNKKWQEQDFPCLKVAVNISIRQFNEADFVETVSEVLDETKLNPEFLELEITESIAIMDQKLTINKLKSLKGLGVQISMDDFGTGYSSLSYLQKYPIDVLKIDKSFITDIANNKENSVIVNSILSIAENLNLDVIAEGVETESELNYLANTSCKFAQGYHIGYPLTAEEFQSNIMNPMITSS